MTKCCLTLQLVLLLLSVALSQKCEEKGETLVGPSESCSSSANCKPSPILKQRTTHFNQTVDVISHLSCSSQVCVQDYTIQDGSPCTRDSSCQSGVCSSLQCQFPIANAPNSVGHDCSAVGVCFGEPNLVCSQEGKCALLQFWGEGDACGILDTVTPRRCSAGLYCDIVERKCRKIRPNSSPCTHTPGPTPQCASGLCSSKKTCIEGGSVGARCDGELPEALSPCQPGLTCNAVERICEDLANKCPDVGDACTTAEGVRNWATNPPTCGCGDSWLVCNDGRYAKKWSIKDGDKDASIPHVCFGDRWLNRREGRCVKELECIEDSDCWNTSPLTTPESDRVWVHCGCGICRHVENIQFSCNQAEASSAASDYCKIKLPNVQERATVNNGIDNATIDINKWIQATQELALDQQRRESMLMRCLFGELDDENGALRTAGGILFPVLVLLIVTFSLYP
eukprot:TRINITY_DN4067_c0_g1_i1.p1 TRINITY_DN4067_c0_g1~~TRINITY_DN4067_c0_g1_i1.p1  ORF type:complete len:454 (+),score=21.52 TRINITY_DN4067_c0_g1_i1:23-1384(+)